MRTILSLVLCTIGLHTSSTLLGAFCLLGVLYLIYKSK